MGQLSVLGVPSSAASYASGQELAPAALRAAGLIDTLAAAGCAVRDHGDLPTQVWRPDRASPRAQNLEDAVRSVQELAERLGPLFADGDTVLIIGGNCTIALGVVAALRRLDAGRPGLLYLDRGYDLNTPLSTTDGALDWMGMAHALDLPGASDAMAGAFGVRPLLDADQVAWLGVEDTMATEWERRQAASLRLRVIGSRALAAEPEAAARRALASLPSGPLTIHFDVDVLDFTDAPLAENTDGRNTGPTLDQVGVALRAATADPRFRALSVAELNPTRSAGEPAALARFVRTLAEVLRPAER